jgi:hypothetical protein
MKNQQSVRITGWNMSAAVSGMLGLVLLIYMVIVEGEPGALPLFLLLLGAVLFGIGRIAPNRLSVLKRDRFIRLLVFVIGLLMIPFVAMQIDHRVDWDVFDFILMGGLLYGTGLLCMLIWRNVRSMEAKIILCASVLILLFLIWIELAVGIFGTPFAGS